MKLESHAVIPAKEARRNVAGEPRSLGLVARAAKPSPFLRGAACANRSRWQRVGACWWNTIRGPSDRP